jgi:hypothetical protein
VLGSSASFSVSRLLSVTTPRKLRVNYSAAFGAVECGADAFPVLSHFRGFEADQPRDFNG